MIKVLTKKEIGEMIKKNNKHLRKLIDKLRGRIDLLERKNEDDKNL